MYAVKPARVLALAALVAAMGLTAGSTVLPATLSAAPLSSGDRDVFVPIPGCRLFDTRPATPVGVKHTKLGSGAKMTVVVRGASGQCNIPNNATAVALTLSYASPSANSGLRAFAPDQTEPSRVDLSFSAGQASRSAAVTVGLSATGKIAIRNLAGSVHVIGDLTGFYAPHNHDDLYAPKVENYLEISADSTAAANGAALAAAMASITDATADNPYTIHLGPGVYDVGAGGLDVKTFVDLEGSGASQTIVTAAGSPDLNFADGGVFGTLRIIGRSELRWLTVRNTGGASTTAVAVFLQGTNPTLRLTSMKVEASGGAGDSMGVMPAQDAFVTDAQLTMNDVDARVVDGEVIGRDNNHHWDMLTIANSRLSVTGGGHVIDALVTNHTTSRMTVADSTLTLDGGGGVIFGASSAASPSIYRNLTVNGSGTNVQGLQVIGGDTPLIQGSSFRLNGAGAKGIGIVGTQVITLIGSQFILTGGGTIGIEAQITATTAIVDASTIQADTILNSLDVDTVVRFGASKLAFTTFKAGTATVTCVSSYKADYTSLSATCT